MPQTLAIRQPGFSLVELLTVTAIIAVLASLMFPVLGRARQTATSMACANAVRHLATASLMASEDHEGRLPTDYDGHDLIGFHYQILPYLRTSAQEEGVSAVFGCPALRDTRQSPEWHLGMRYNFAVNRYLPGTQVSGILRPAQIVLFFDSPATVDARAASAFWADSQPYRHRGAINAVYVDGHMGSVNAAEGRARNRVRDADADSFGPRSPAGIALAPNGVPQRPVSRPDGHAYCGPRSANSVNPACPDPSMRAGACGG